MTDQVSMEWSFPESTELLGVLRGIGQGSDRGACGHTDSEVPHTSTLSGLNMTQI